MDDADLTSPSILRLGGEAEIHVRPSRLVVQRARTSLSKSCAGAKANEGRPALAEGTQIGPVVKRKSSFKQSR